MSTDGWTELTGPFADVIRRLVRLGWPGHGDPAVEQTAMRARDVLASVGCDPDTEHTRRAVATTATCIIEQLQTLLDDRPDDSPLARQLRWALVGHAAAWCATVGFEIVQVDPDQPLDVQLACRRDHRRTEPSASRPVMSPRPRTGGPSCARDDQITATTTVTRPTAATVMTTAPANGAPLVSPGSRSRPRAYAADHRRQP